MSWSHSLHAIACPIEGLLLLELKTHRDNRGFFSECYRADWLREIGLPTNFIQDNHSRSLPGVLRGLHYQTEPSQGKLVNVVRGRIWDVAVDIRPTSSTFGQYYGVELSDENGLQFWIPPGFAHGFVVLGDEPADVYYKVNAAYNPSSEGGIRYDDQELAIRWPLKDVKISSRDQGLPSFKYYKENPPKWRITAEA